MNGHYKFQKYLLYQILGWIIPISKCLTEMEAVLQGLTISWRHLLTSPLVVYHWPYRLALSSVAKKLSDTLIASH